MFDLDDVIRTLHPIWGNLLAADKADPEENYGSDEKPVPMPKPLNRKEEIYGRES